MTDFEKMVKKWVVKDHFNIKPIFCSILFMRCLTHTYICASILLILAEKI